MATLIEDSEDEKMIHQNSIKVNFWSNFFILIEIKKINIFKIKTTRIINGISNKDQ
jgi:hypothetical protein